MFTRLQSIQHFACWISWKHWAVHGAFEWDDHGPLWNSNFVHFCSFMCMNVCTSLHLCAWATRGGFMRWLGCVGREFTGILLESGPFAIISSSKWQFFRSKTGLPMCGPSYAASRSEFWTVRIWTLNLEIDGKFHLIPLHLELFFWIRVGGSVTIRRPLKLDHLIFSRRCSLEISCSIWARPDSLKLRMRVFLGSSFWLHKLELSVCTWLH